MDGALISTYYFINLVNLTEDINNLCNLKPCFGIVAHIKLSFFILTDFSNSYITS